VGGVNNLEGGKLEWLLMSMMCENVKYKFKGAQI